MCRSDLKILQPPGSWSRKKGKLSQCLLHSLQHRLGLCDVGHGNAPCSVKRLLSNGDRNVGQVGTIVGVTRRDDLEIKIVPMARGCGNAELRHETGYDKRVDTLALESL